MKSLILLFVVSITSFRASASSVCPSGWVCPATPVYTSDIGAWYSLYWLKPESPISHWKDWARYKPLQGHYTIGEAHTVSAHFSAMKGAGIDFLIFDHTNGIGNDAGTIEQNARNVVANNAKLPATYQLQISVALGYGLWGAKSVEAQNSEAEHIWKNYVEDPHYKKIDGKPLLVVYNSIESDKDCFACNWNDPRFNIRRAGGMIDGTNPALQKYAGEGIWGWVMKSPLIASPEAITVMPGWDTKHLGRSTTPIDRANGEYYMKQWLFAIKSNPRNIIIASWNDWAEETSIEPAVSTGAPKWVDSYGTEVPDYYLQITAAYGNLKKGLMPDFYYKDEDDTTVYVVSAGKLVAQGAMPRGKAVVMLPSGTIKKLLGSSGTAPSAPTGDPNNNDKISAGFFKVGGTLGYSNGGSYCLFDNMANFTALTGKINDDGITSFPQLPGGMKNDGICVNPNAKSSPNSSSAAKYPEGVFKVGAAIAYSNGQDTYCLFGSMEHLKELTGKTSAAGIKEYASFPTAMTNNGQCKKK